MRWPRVAIVTRGACADTLYTSRRTLRRPTHLTRCTNEDPPHRPAAGLITLTGIKRNRCAFLFSSFCSVFIRLFFSSALLVLLIAKGMLEDARVCTAQRRAPLLCSRLAELIFAQPMSGKFNLRPFDERQHPLFGRHSQRGLF